VLAEGKASITACDENGSTALLQSAGNLPMLQWLLTKGKASITERDKNGATAMLRAADFVALDCILFLLEHGCADIPETTIFYGVRLTVHETSSGSS
jgi:ankyrin repeat protein